MNRISSIILGLTLLASATPALACFHKAKSEHAKVGANSYKGLIFHADGHEELILGADLKVEGESLSHLGWVLAVPKVPENYSTDVSPEVFNEALKLFPKKKPGRGTLSFGGPEKSKSKPLKVTVIKVGPYVIHQIETVGDQAVAALNGWFKKNGYDTKDEKSMRFFVERQYTYLCIRVNPSDPKAFKKSSKLPPLRISFESQRPFFPLKFTSHQGVFDLDLIMFTKHPIDWLRSDSVLKQLNTSVRASFGTFKENRNVKTVLFKGSLKKLWQQIHKEKRLAKVLEWNLNYLQAYRVNRKDNPISNWSEDIFFSLDRNPKLKQTKKLLTSFVAKKVRASKVKQLIKSTPQNIDTYCRCYVAIPNDKLRTYIAMALSEHAHKKALRAFAVDEKYKSSTPTSACVYVAKTHFKLLDAKGFPWALKALKDKPKQHDPSIPMNDNAERVAAMHNLLVEYTGETHGFAKSVKSRSKDLLAIREAWMKWLASHKTLTWSEAKGKFE